MAAQLEAATATDEVAVPPEAERAAAELAAAARAVAASLPFGADPAGFLAALERLAVSEGELRVPEALP